MHRAVLNALSLMIVDRSECDQTHAKQKKADSMCHIPSRCRREEKQCCRTLSPKP